MSTRIGHKHEHARDQRGFPGCHSHDCTCARCLLENGAAIPKDRRAQVEQYREDLSEMWKCAKCGGVRVSLINADPKRKIPATLWCMTCGAERITSETDQAQRLTNRVEKEKPSLRDRMMDDEEEQPKPQPQPQKKMRLSDRMIEIEDDGKRERQPSVSAGRWTPEERRDLQALIEKHGTRRGSQAYIAKYPERGRTIQGCEYQWNMAISKGKGLK